jgi:hypothetical protein
MAIGSGATQWLMAAAVRRHRAHPWLALPTGKTFDTWDPNLSLIPDTNPDGIACAGVAPAVARTSAFVVRQVPGKTFCLEALGQLAPEVGSKWPGSAARISASWCAAIALTIRSPKQSQPSSAQRPSSLTT